jgi:hypothetical protein
VKQTAEKGSPPSSRPSGPPVNISPDGMTIDERALESSYTHGKALRGFLALERRILGGPAEPRGPVYKPCQTAAVLKAIALVHPPGSPVSRSQAAEAAGCTTYVAEQVKRWAVQAGRWPYTTPKGIGKRPGGDS